MTPRIPDHDPRRDPPTEPYPEQQGDPGAAEHDLWTDGQGAGAEEQGDGGTPEMCLIPDSTGSEPQGAYRAPDDPSGPEGEPSGAFGARGEPSGAHRAAVSVQRSKAADRAAVRAFRPQRRVPAVVVALLLTLLGLLVALETLSGLFGRPLRWIPYEGMRAWAASTLWSNPLVLLASAVVTLLGLALLITAVAPGRPSMVPVRSGDPDVIVGLRPKSVTRALAHAAEQVPGVHSARAVRRGHTFEVRPTTYGRDTGEFGQEVRGAVLTRLAALDLVEPYRVTVQVKERRRR
ncbi:hypothetical protein GCM10009733_074410 [Nonomuraea maheshkhaliensis]|uniref:DUF6286 domain-containing protein n=1 Tax=Nonomuraea maheshkhaliensis TaxID=419590 RepID=A0ABN2G5X1_9ACTN